MILKQDKFGYIILEKSAENINYFYRRLEQIAEEFLNRLEVQNEIKFYKKKTEFSSSRTGKNFFIVAKPNCLTIYQKKISTGYIYNSKFIEKIAKFILVESRESNFESFKGYERPFNQKAAEWCELHTELISSRKIKSVIPDVIAGL